MSLTKSGSTIFHRHLKKHSSKHDGIFSITSYSNYYAYCTYKLPLVPDLEETYLCNPDNRDEIINNIKIRKGVGDITKVLQLNKEASLEHFLGENDTSTTRSLLIKEMLKIPNRTHPDVLKYGDMPRVLKTLGSKKEFNFKSKTFHNIANSMNQFRNDCSNFTGHRSYFFTGHLAELESALVKFSLIKLVDLGFKIVSVPDILDRSIIESCGMATKGERNQVYTLNTEQHGDDKCLSGTAEMSLAAYLMNKKLAKDKLPLRLAAVSRCFRAETSRTSEEKGIYRVHQFTKVEMFGVSEPEKSSDLLEEFRVFQEEHFLSLGLHLQVLDMPAHELGAQAYRKYDVEAWLPGKDMWAEVSSCSNCTDYQSRRLSITSDGRYVHTVNGTACAVPRLIIALFETHQQSDGSVLIPLPLQHLMRNVTVMKKNSKTNPQLTPIKRQSKKA